MTDTDDARADEEHAEDLHPEPVVVATYLDRGEAEVTKAHLLANGIHAEIIDEVDGGTVPVNTEDGVGVLVPAQDADAAREILAD